MSSPSELEAYHFYRNQWDDYEQLLNAFEWEIPDQFNMADYVCDRWAEQDGIAIHAENPEGERRVFTYQQVSNITNQLAGYLEEKGVKPGDRVGVNVPQKAESALAHIAIWKLGAVSIPLSVLFGPEGLEYRLGNSDAVACVVDGSNLDTFRQVANKLPKLHTVLTVGDPSPEGTETDFWEALESQPIEFENAPTAPDDDAIIIYTSGTTGNPKGALHGHQILLGNLPCFLTGHCNLDLEDGDVFWMPMEWAWVGLFNFVFCPMFYGKSVVAYERRQFEPDRAYEILDRYGVTHFLSVPTALRMMMQEEEAAERNDVSQVRVVSSGGEKVGTSIVDWVKETFDGAVVNITYGQTEANIITGTCVALMEFRGDTIGKEAPGHEVKIVDSETSKPLEESGNIGEIAVRYEQDPVCFKEYWSQPEITDEKRKNGWHLMEDLGWRDEDGYLHFVSRKDDVILCSGYRVDPEEVEETIIGHEAVADCGVIGVPHETRGEVPKAFVVLAEGYSPGDDLKKELQQFVKKQVAKYEYPRELEFIDKMPTNAVGKKRRVDLRKLEGIEA